MFHGSMSAAALVVAATQDALAIPQATTTHLLLAHHALTIPGCLGEITTQPACIVALITKLLKAEVAYIVRPLKAASNQVRDVF